MAFTAADVKNLREMTGVGMLDCKKALAETDGDMDKAVELLREKGLAAAQKKAGRIAAEGMAYAEVFSDGAALVEVNAETDFVAKNAQFIEFVKDVCYVVGKWGPVDMDTLMTLPYRKTGMTVQQALQDKIMVIGENIKIRRFVRYDSGVSVAYNHMNGRIGVLLSIIMACLFYALLLFCIGAAWPWQDFYLNTESPAAANVFAKIFAGSAMGNVMYILLCAGALCGLLTTWNSFFMGTANLMMALARTHMLPFALSKRSAKTGTPVNALIVCLVASIVGPFLGLGLIDPLTTFSAAAYVVSWGLAAFCLIKLRKTEPNLPRPYKIPGGLPMAWFAALSMVAILIMMFIPGTPAYIGGMAVKMFLAWCVVGVAMFLATAPSRNQKSPEERYNNLFANAAQQHQKDLMMD